jgi:hypothetical protein
MRIAVLLVLLPLACLPLFSQGEDVRGLKTIVSQLAGDDAAVGKQYAVLIAVDKYKSWTALRNPVRDAREIREILDRKYFVTDFLELYDEAATKAGIIKLFNRIIAETKPEDSVFIFYAGHGHLDKTSNTGFWIPVDGGTDVFEQSNWLPNAQIRGFVSNMRARHVVLIADSCFSGDFLNPTRGIAPTITSEYFRNAYARVSRQVLTSGASESVPDESPFSRQLKLALEGNTAPYLDPLMLYNQIRLGVTQTTPLFGDLKDSGHQEGSSFLFFLKSTSTEKPAPASAAASTRLTLKKVYGTISVEARTGGSLYLDGVLQGEVPVGNIAAIENVEFGRHELELRYPNGQAERQTVTVDRQEAVSIRFTRTFAAPAEKPAPAAAAPGPAAAAPGPAATQPPKPAAPQAQKKELAPLDPLPVASIKVDGNIDDWAGIVPAILNHSYDTGKLTIDKVFLAMDDDNLYFRMDIKDDTPSSFFHPSNFDTAHNSQYQLIIENKRIWVVLNVIYDVKGGRWAFEVGRDVSGRWTADRNNGGYALKGSSLEARYPLSRLREYLGGAEGDLITIRAKTGYSDSDWKWVDGSGDDTLPRNLTF